MVGGKARNPGHRISKRGKLFKKGTGEGLEKVMMVEDDKGDKTRDEGRDAENDESDDEETAEITEVEDARNSLKMNQMSPKVCVQCQPLKSANSLNGRRQ